MSFSITIDNLFSELWGFVLCVPAALDAFHGGESRGMNLLERYASTDDGDRVAEMGIAIPIMGVEVGSYTIVVRSDQQESRLAKPRIESPGWVLNVTAPLAVCGAGYLVVWDPHHPAVHQIEVPLGWYQVTINGGYQGAVEEETWIIEFVLSKALTPPHFSANLGQSFNFIDPDDEIGDI